jgi:MFS family permease
MASQLLRRLQTLGPGILLYLCSIFLVGFAIDGGIYTVLLNLFLIRLDYGPSDIGAITAAGQITFAIMSLPAGILGSRFTSRRMLQIGLLMLCLGGSIMPLGQLITPDLRLYWLMGWNAVLYIGLSCFFVNTAPFVITLVQSSARTQVVSVQTAVHSSSSVVGSLLGGYLPLLIAWSLPAEVSQAVPYRIALSLAGLTIALALYCISRTPKTSVIEPAQSSETTSTSNGKNAGRSIVGLLIVIAIVRLFQAAGLGVTNTFFNVYLDTELNVLPQRIGQIMALGRLLGVPAALATTSLSRRFGVKNVIMAATFSTALSILLIALVPNWIAASLGLFGVLCSTWIRYSASVVFFLELVPPSYRAILNGVVEMASGICFAGLSFGGGLLVEHFSFQHLFLLSSGLSFMGVVSFWLVFRNHQASNN